MICSDSALLISSNKNMDFKALSKPVMLLVAAILAGLVVAFQMYHTRFITPQIEYLNSKIEEFDRVAKMYGNSINELMTRTREATNTKPLRSSGGKTVSFGPSSSNSGGPSTSTVLMDDEENVSTSKPSYASIVKN